METVETALAEAVAAGLVAEDALWLCPSCSHIVAAQPDPPRTLTACIFCDTAFAGWTDADWIAVRRLRYHLA